MGKESRISINLYLIMIVIAVIVGGAFLLIVPLKLTGVADVGIKPPAKTQAPGIGLPQTGEPNVVIRIYGGELPDGSFGFGFDENQLTSPGPTIRVRVGDVVKVTFINIGEIRHGFAVVEKVEKTNPKILFDAVVGPPQNPLEPGMEESVIFVATEPGTYYYQCPVANHGPKGMWGEFIVEP